MRQLNIDKWHYYSFKIFPCFWLVKTTRIIHHNQPLLTKFGKNFIILNRWRQNDVKSAALLQIIEPLTKKTWGRDWIVLVVRTKWRNCWGKFYSFHGEILFKNIARTARRQLDGHLLLIWSIYICRPEQTLIRCIMDMNLDRSRLACFSLFLNLELFWRNDKTIIDGYIYLWLAPRSCSLLCFPRRLLQNSEHNAAQYLDWLEDALLSSLRSCDQSYLLLLVHSTRPKHWTNI